MADSDVISTHIPTTDSPCQRAPSRRGKESNSRRHACWAIAGESTSIPVASPKTPPERRPRLRSGEVHNNGGLPDKRRPCARDSRHQHERARRACPACSLHDACMPCRWSHTATASLSFGNARQRVVVVSVRITSGSLVMSWRCRRVCPGGWGLPVRPTPGQLVPTPSRNAGDWTSTSLEHGGARER